MWSLDQQHQYHQGLAGNAEPQTTRPLAHSRASLTSALVTGSEPCSKSYYVAPIVPIPSWGAWLQGGEVNFSGFNSQEMIDVCFKPSVRRSPERVEVSTDIPRGGKRWEITPIKPALHTKPFTWLISRDLPDPSVK